MSGAFSAKGGQFIVVWGAKGGRTFLKRSAGSDAQKYILGK
jgi:hypothetical protein